MAGGTVPPPPKANILTRLKYFSYVKTDRLLSSCYMVATSERGLDETETKTETETSLQSPHLTWPATATTALFYKNNQSPQNHKNSFFPTKI